MSYLKPALCLLLFSAIVLFGQDDTIKSLTARAQAGDAEAQFALGRNYEDGKGVPQDDSAAVTWFRKAAEQGNAKAENSLGVMYALGRGVPRDREEAVRWYKKAAKRGLGDGAYNVAISYFNGEGVPSDLAASFAWMTIAIDQGDKQALEARKHIEQEMSSRVQEGLLKLAELYEEGSEISQDPKRAVAAYRELAEQGPKKSLYAERVDFKLCTIYFQGKLVPVDYPDASVFCKKSAQEGNRWANLIVGEMYEKGLGFAPAPEKAQVHYRNAGILGAFEGYARLARTKLQSGSHDDLREAYQWAYLANMHNVAGAADEMGQAGKQLSEKEVKGCIKSAIAWDKMKNPEKMAKLKLH